MTKLTNRNHQFHVASLDVYGKGSTNRKPPKIEFRILSLLFIGFDMARLSLSHVSYDDALDQNQLVASLIKLTNGHWECTVLIFPAG